jgi:hypothetical protein
LIPVGANCKRAVFQLIFAFSYTYCKKSADRFIVLQIPLMIKCFFAVKEKGSQNRGFRGFGGFYFFLTAISKDSH